MAWEKQNGATTSVQTCTEQIEWKQPCLGNSLTSSIYACLRFPTAGCGWLSISLTSDPPNYSSESLKDTYLSVPDFTQRLQWDSGMWIGPIVPTLKTWWIFSALKFGGPNLSLKKSKYPHTLQVWNLHNKDLNIHFHLQKGMQVCKEFIKEVFNSKKNLNFLNGPKIPFKVIPSASFSIVLSFIKMQ